jgi:predicted RNase H-like HicB family nuclease
VTEYTVILEQGATNWSAYVPDVPGCVAAAKTRDETERLIAEALAFHLEALRANGQPTPLPTTLATRVSVSA